LSVPLSLETDTRGRTSLLLLALVLFGPLSACVADVTEKVLQPLPIDGWAFTERRVDPNANAVIFENLSVKIEVIGAKLSHSSSSGPIFPAFARKASLVSRYIGSFVSSKGSHIVVDLRNAMVVPPCAPGATLTLGAAEKMVIKERFLRSFRQEWPIEIGKDESVKVDVTITADLNTIDKCSLRFSDIARPLRATCRTCIFSPLLAELS
jgi:hypothetical protein